MNVGEEDTLIEVDDENIQPDGMPDVRIPGAIVFEVKKLPIYGPPSPGSVPTVTWPISPEAARRALLFPPDRPPEPITRSEYP
jgi:hypothetical protein